MFVQRILVGYDGKEQSEHALELAIDLSMQYNAEIHLAFIVHEPFQMADPMSDEVNESFVKIGQKTLSNAVRTVRKRSIIPVTHLENGNPGKKLLELADKIKPDLVILGMMKHSLYEKTLGSVSSYFLNSKQYPLILVP